MVGSTRRLSRSLYPRPAAHDTLYTWLMRVSGSFVHPPAHVASSGCHGNRVYTYCCSRRELKMGKEALQESKPHRQAAICHLGSGPPLLIGAKMVPSIQKE
ncbi:hypothetical protein EYF80_004617 [Liparis tanakae]|uniref:Uncharacterized protein n=1 Tax=Liparis tanakae TaxID=230148 RepID=A0A4Z2J5I1_9TELE|nr:hypothetical protein EYF80_004617 [Liparis tanakae]